MGCAGAGAAGGQVCLAGVGQEGRHRWEGTPSQSKWTVNAQALTSSNRSMKILELLFVIKRKDKHRSIF